MKPKVLIKKTLSLETAMVLVERAVQKAKEMGVGAAVAVVDEGGHLICFERLDGTIIAAADITIGKAITALTFRRPGKVLENTIEKERISMLAVAGVTEMVPLMGSYPIKIEGEIVGAIAIGGAASANNDEIIVNYAMDILLDK